MAKREFDLPALVSDYVQLYAEKWGVSESDVVTFAVGVLAVEQELLSHGAVSVAIRGSSRPIDPYAIELRGLAVDMFQLAPDATFSSEHLVARPGDFGFPPLRSV